MFHLITTTETDGKIYILLVYAPNVVLHRHLHDGPTKKRFPTNTYLPIITLLPNKTMPPVISCFPQMEVNVSRQPNNLLSATCDSGSQNSVWRWHSAENRVLDSTSEVTYHDVLRLQKYTVPRDRTVHHSFVIHNSQSTTVCRGTSCFTTR